VNATFVNGGVPQYMKLWVDGVAKNYNNNSATYSYTLSLAAGSHQLSVQAYNGTLYRAAESITVAASGLSITPTTASLTAGQTLQFTANEPVTWSAVGGSITAGGLFTAPNSTMSCIVTATDAGGNQATATVSVSATTLPSVAITAPLANASVSAPFTLTAAFNNGGIAQYMKLWIDGVAQAPVANTTQLSKTLSLASGKHKLTVQAYNGALYSSSEYVTVQ
jgi:uncharacterized protein YjdB